MYIYTDDMALRSTRKSDPQETFNRLVTWTEQNRLQINQEKEVQMQFRTGRRKTAEDTVYFKQEPLRVTNAFKYLGVTLLTTTKSYSIHIKESHRSYQRAVRNKKSQTTQP
jgi:superfamily II RNA helicase